MGWFSEPPEAGGPSDVNPETEGHAKLLKATIYTLAFEGRGSGWEMGQEVAWRIQASDLDERSKAGSESPSGWGSTGSADVVFRASGPAFVHTGIRLLDGKVVSATVFSSLFA